MTETNPPAVWWSPTLGVIEAAEAVLYIHGGDQEIPNLPADAVRLVPESEVQFVLDDNERMLAQHASDVAEIERLREDKRLFQDMFMSATAHNTAVCEALGLSYEAETETVVAAIQKALHPMLMLDSETGAVSLAGAVPDTGQARTLREFADDVERRLPLLREPDEHSDWSDGVAWVLDRMRNAAAEPSRDTVQAPDVTEPGVVTLLGTDTPEGGRG